MLERSSNDYQNRAVYRYHVRVLRLCDFCCVFNQQSLAFLPVFLSVSTRRPLFDVFALLLPWRPHVITLFHCFFHEIIHRFSMKWHYFLVNTFQVMRSGYSRILFSIFSLYFPTDRSLLIPQKFIFPPTSRQVLSQTGKTWHVVLTNVSFSRYVRGDWRGLWTQCNRQTFDRLTLQTATNGGKSINIIACDVYGD